MRLFKPYMSLWSALYVLKTMFSGQIAEGPQVKLFEEEFSKKFNKKNVVAVNSGTSALELAYELAGIGEGDEVIAPVLTCTATNLPLIHRKAKIVFADISNIDLNICIQDVKRKITKKTKAIVFVHFGGNNRGLEEIQKICKQYGLICIEDAAQAVGSDYWGNSDFACVSLQAIKTLTSGDGGFLICKSKKSYGLARRLRWFGYDREKKQKLGDTDLKEAGYKYHMNDISAAIGRGNLRMIDKVIAHRKKLAEFYNSQLGVTCYPWLCIQWGVKGNQHHYRNDKYTVFKKFKNKCPNMDKMQDWRLLPYHYGVSLRQAKKCIAK